ncbi:MAG: uridine kinase [Microbacteriaceae bacterium]|jgi:uridine kinase|nr:uridine kinase [Microbacteriaceae bacterium]
MATWAPEKKDTLESLATEILHNYGVGRAIVAVDGASGSGSRQFADDLAAAMRLGGRKVFRASLSDFHRPRSAWENPNPEPAEAFYAETFDYSVLRRVLIDPFRASGSTGFVLAAYDARREAKIQPKWMTAGTDAVLVIDGVFINRPELAGLWNYSIWVEAPLPQNPGDVAAEADALYLDRVRPRTVATSIIDNRDVDHPRRVFADSC